MVLTGINHNQRSWIMKEEVIGIMKRNDNVEQRTSYESPQMKILQLDVSDVIATSGVEITDKGAGFIIESSDWNW